MSPARCATRRGRPSAAVPSVSGWGGVWEAEGCIGSTLRTFGCVGLGFLRRIGGRLAAWFRRILFLRNDVAIDPRAGSVLLRRRARQQPADAFFHIDGAVFSG